jgi:hypothetical protein
MTNWICGRPARRLIVLTTALAATTPALADHMGPGGVGLGGGLTVFGPGTLDGEHWAAGLRVVYTRPERRSDAELKALAEQQIHAHNTDYNLNASAGVAYGLSHHLTLSAELPFVRRDDLREGTQGHVGGVAVNGVEQLGTVSGIGDLNLLAKYRLTEGERSGFALVAGLKVPTGSTRERSIGGERLETEHQPGSGSWDPIMGASAGTKLGPVQLTASGIYQWSTEGAQRTRLGNRMQGGIAVSHHFGDGPHEHGESHNHHRGDELDEHRAEHPHSSWDAFVEVAGEWEGRQRIDGETEQASGSRWVYVAPGLRFNAAAGWSMGAGLALPIWQRIGASHPDNRFRLTLSLGRSF